MPVYNVEKFIAQSIESVLNQTYRDIELVIVDDCGTDASIVLAKEYAKKDSRIKIIHHDKNRGVAAARNTALDNATGEYIMWLDPDDWYEKNCVEVAISELKLRKTSSVWFNANRYYDTEKGYDWREYVKYPDGFVTITPQNIASYADFVWNKAYTRESIERYKIRMHEGMTFEDGEFYLKYFTLNPDTYFISDKLLNYRLRQGSIVREADAGKVHMEHIYSILGYLKEFWINLGVFDKYEYLFLRLLSNRLKLCKSLNFCDENIKLSQKCIEDVGFSSEFEAYKSISLIEKPVVSIVVAVNKNCFKDLSYCLQSLLEQNYKNIEIICCNNVCSNKINHVLDKFVSNHKNIKVYSEKHISMNILYNKAISEASGKYLIFVDSQDFVAHNFLDYVMDAVEKFKLNLACFNIDYINNYENKAPLIKEGFMAVNSNSIKKVPFTIYGKVYKKRFLINNKIFFLESIDGNVVFILKALLNSLETFFIADYLYISNNIEVESMSNVKIVDNNTLRVIKEFFEQKKLFTKYKNLFFYLYHRLLLNYKGYKNIDLSKKQEIFAIFKDCD